MPKWVAQGYLSDEVPDGVPGRCWVTSHRQVCRLAVDGYRATIEVKIVDRVEHRVVTAGEILPEDHGYPVVSVLGATGRPHLSRM